MNYQHHDDTADRPDSVPALLAINDAIQVRDRVWIFKDSSGRFEGNSMLPAIGTIFVLIPKEHHSVYIQNCSTEPGERVESRALQKADVNVRFADTRHLASFGSKLTDLPAGHPRT